MDTKQLKQKILDLAIRGKLVPQDPNDEPASVLLERIRKEKEQLIAIGKLKKTKSKTSDTPHYENVPFDIPDSWEWVRLIDIASFGGGKTPSMNITNYWQQGIHLWVTSKDMKSDRISDSQMKISDEALSIMTQYDAGTILIVTRSGVLRHSLPLAILDKKATVNQDLKTISLYIQEVCQYIFYAIKANENLILKKYHKDGTTVDSINFEEFVNIYIPIPPLAEQKRIVAEIKQCFALIDEIETNKNDLQEAIKTTKSKVLNLAIHGKLVPQDPNDEPAIELLKRINPAFKPCDTSHYENLPETWCVAHMGEVNNHTTGKALKKADSAGELRQYITTSNVYWNSFDFTEVRSMYFTKKELDKCTVHKGDLLVCNGGDVGRAAIWDYDYDICYQNHISRLRPISVDIVFNPFYSYLFRYLKDKGQLNGKGVAITSLSAADIQSLATPVPPLAEQKRIVKRIETIFAQLDTITAEL